MAWCRSADPWCRTYQRILTAQTYFQVTALHITKCVLSSARSTYSLPGVWLPSLSVCICVCAHAHAHDIVFMHKKKFLINATHIYLSFIMWHARLFTTVAKQWS
jgi:hypothetical protein